MINNLTLDYFSANFVIISERNLKHYDNKTLRLRRYKICKKINYNKTKCN